MPHIFVNRPRMYNLMCNDAELKAQFRWETINAILYKVGGGVFIVGSIFFFPSMEAFSDLGAWAFILGSLLYLIVTGHDFLEVRRHAKNRRNIPTIWDKLEEATGVSYLVGTILFMVGSVFFLSTFGFFIAGAWCFVIGSILFLIGATINVLQIIQAADKLTLQLMNLTALSFVTGSLLFAVASIPYLWHVESPYDREIINAFLAWQYVAGSLLFLLGGIFNYWRAWIVVARARTAAS